MSGNEEVFESSLKALGQDGHSCAAFIYTELALRHVAANDPNVGEQIEVDNAFWSPVLAALQTAGVVALDRLYDEQRNAGNAAHVLRFAVRHKEIFCGTELEARNRAAGLSARTARRRSANAYELRDGRLEPLFRELDEKRRVYAAAAPALHEHLVSGGNGVACVWRRRWIGDYPVHELEQLAVFPLRLHRALSALYHDGREPVLENVPTSIADVLCADRPVRDLWDHCRAARSVVAFLEWRAFNQGWSAVQAAEMSSVRSWNRRA